MYLELSKCRIPIFYVSKVNNLREERHVGTGLRGVWLDLHRQIGMVAI